MTDTIRKRRKREQRAGFDAWLVWWRALDNPRRCRVCYGIGTIQQHGDGAVPCPHCRPDRAREAARGATP